MRKQKEKTTVQWKGTKRETDLKGITVVPQTFSFCPTSITRVKICYGM